MLVIYPWVYAFIMSILIDGVSVLLSSTYVLHNFFILFSFD